MPSYGKKTLLLPFDNGFLKLSNVWYAPDLDFNLISIIYLGKKGVEMWIQTTNQLSQILYNRAILGYTDPIDKQYVFWLKKTIKFSAIANSIDTQPKKKIKPGDIKLWHLHIGYLGHRSLTILKNLSSGTDSKKITQNKLCEDY